MQMPKRFNYVDDRSNKEIQLPIIWKHVLNNSKVVETFPLKMAELIDNYYQINVTPMKIFHPRKKI